jgi:hypothetical protein
MLEHLSRSAVASPGILWLAPGPAWRPSGTAWLPPSGGRTADVNARDVAGNCRAHPRRRLR